MSKLYKVYLRTRVNDIGNTTTLSEYIAVALGKRDTDSSRLMTRIEFHEQYNKFNARPAKPEKAITITGSTGMRISAVKALRDISAEPLDLRAAVDIIDRLPTPFTLSKWKGSRTSAVNTLRAASLIVA